MDPSPGDLRARWAIPSGSFPIEEVQGPGGVIAIFVGAPTQPVTESRTVAGTEVEFDTYGGLIGYLVQGGGTSTVTSPPPNSMAGYYKLYIFPPSQSDPNAPQQGIIAFDRPVFLGKTTLPTAPGGPEGPYDVWEKRVRVHA